MAFRQVTITAAVPTKIAAFEKRRRTLSFVNNGTGRIFISNDQANLIAEGFPIDPGVSVSFSVVDGDDPRLALFAQSAAGDQDVRVHEDWARED